VGSKGKVMLFNDPLEKTLLRPVAFVVESSRKPAGFLATGFLHHAHSPGVREWPIRLTT